MKEKEIYEQALEVIVGYNLLDNDTQEDIEDSYNLAIEVVRKALTELEELKRDVKELLGVINHLEHLEVADNYVPDINWERYSKLRSKLEKVGKENE